MTEPLSDHDKTPNRKRKRTDIPTLLMLFGGVVYLIHAATVLIPLEINRAKWQRQHINNYEIVVDRIGAPFGFGHVQIVISDGEISEAEWCAHAFNELLTCDSEYAGSLEPEQAKESTIEGLFDSLHGCAWLFYWCGHIEYNNQYGYPAGAASRWRVTSFEPLD